MKYKISNLIYDFKSMGINAFIPIIFSLGIMSLMTIVNIKLRYESVSLMHVIPPFEMVIPVIASWWSIFLMQRIIEEKGNEVYFSYPTSRYYYGVIRVLRGYLIYILCIAIVLAYTHIIIKEQIFLSLLLQLTLQSFFYASLGFMTMCLLGKAGFSVLIIMAYFSLQVLTGGDLIPFINIYIFNKSLMSISQIKGLLVKTLTFGLAFCIFGQILLNKMILSEY